jgi:type IV pilus assembly protein PilB
VKQVLTDNYTPVGMGMVIPNSILSFIPYALAAEYFVIPTGVDEKGRIEALMAYPSDHQTLQRIQLYTGKLIKPTAISKEEILQIIAKHYGAITESSKNVPTPLKEDLKTSCRLSYNKTNTTTVLVDDILHEAIRLRTSDIHLEPFEREMCVRFRIDGVLQEMMAIPRERVPEVTSRIKIMAGMDIAEKRRAQDGRIRINNQQHDVDIRVSTLPTDFGEKVVLRLLDKSSFNFNLETIGMDQKQLSLFRRAIQMPNGIVLITGPTGSGKSTSLYGVINYLKKPGLNISTIEDPIEYNITGVNQTQVNTLTGVTFASSLRTLLRQDPDIIMVGEMRDQETGEIAVRSSLTGHLVLSTLHTNDAPSAITRLVDMGIEPYLVASSLTMIVAQRLVRKICEHCSCEEQVPENIRQSIGLASETPVFKGLGCSACGFTGYKGRTGIFEVLPISEPIRALIKEKAYASEIRSQAITEGLVSLRDHALNKLQQGITSLEEVMREVSVLS